MLDGARLCPPVLDGARLCLPVLDGARLCLPVPDGAQRPAVSAVPDGARCVRLCSPAPQRYPLRRRRYWRHLGLYIKEEGHLTQW